MTDQPVSSPASSAQEPVASPARDVAGRLVELAIFAPVGLAVRAREELPRLVEIGRARAAARVDIARLIGRIAAEQGRAVIRRSVVGSAEVPVDDNTAPFSARPSAPEVAQEGKSADPDLSAGPAVGDLAIDHYDSLAAPQVVALLPSLSAAELDDVDRYERAHRNRRTITGKISQLRA